MTRGVAECFVRQQSTHTCIAACACIILRRRGEIIEEATIAQRWGSPPYALVIHGASLGPYQQLDPDDPVSRDYLRARLLDQWLVVTIMPAPGRMAHAVVVIAAAEGRWPTWIRRTRRRSSPARCPRRSSS